MATGKAGSQKDQDMAAYLKKMGIRRTTGRCCVCYRIISIPTDNHFKYYCK